MAFILILQCVAFKQYLFGSTAVLGTAAIMYRVIKPKKEFTGLTRGILELVERSEKELREEQEEIATLEEKARRMEKIRIVRQVVIREASLVEGGGIKLH